MTMEYLRSEVNRLNNVIADRDYEIAGLIEKFAAIQKELDEVKGRYLDVISSPRNHLLRDDCIIMLGENIGSISIGEIKEMLVRARRKEQELVATSAALDAEIEESQHLSKQIKEAEEKGIRLGFEAARERIEDPPFAYPIRERNWEHHD